MAAAALNKGGDATAKAALRAAGRALGILQGDPEAWLKGAEVSDEADGFSADKVEALLVGRAAARTNRDFAEADRIRDELKTAGVVLEDRPDGTTEWRRA